MGSREQFHIHGHVYYLWSDHIGHHQTVTLSSYFNDALILVSNPKTAKFYIHNRQTV